MLRNGHVHSIKQLRGLLHPNGIQHVLEMNVPCVVFSTLFFLFSGRCTTLLGQHIGSLNEQLTLACLQLTILKMIVYDFDWYCFATVVLACVEMTVLIVFWPVDFGIISTV